MTTTIRNFTTALLFLALPALMVGCDGGGSGMQEEQEMEELTLTIKNPASSGAKANTTITREASSLEEGDQLNVFVNGTGDVSGETREDFGINYPKSGGTVVAEFVVPAGDYDVDLLGFRDYNTPDRNSAIVFATTGDGDGNVVVNSGEVTEVDFRGGDNNDQDATLFTEFGLSFNANLQFAGDGNQFEVTLENSKGNASALAGRLFTEDTPLGGVGIDPSGIDAGDRTTARNGADFQNRSGATFDTGEGTINLAPGQYRDGTASVLLELQVSDEYIDTDNQDPVFLYNNVNGSAEDGVNIGGDDGGIIIII